jgi:hypothetical protein
MLIPKSWFVGKSEKFPLVLDLTDLCVYRDLRENPVESGNI